MSGREVMFIIVIVAGFTGLIVMVEGGMSWVSLMIACFGLVIIADVVGEGAGG